MRVLLLNPPFERPCIRDNYCSYTSKAGDLWTPVDLLVQSGLLAARHEVRALDAVADECSVEDCVRLVEEFRPEAILALTGSLSWSGDLKLLKRLAELPPNPRIVLTGDFLLAEGQPVLAAEKAISGILLDYTVDSLARWLADEPGPYAALALQGAAVSPPGPGPYTHPIPRHDLFPWHRYRLSVATARPFATMVTSIGCNFHCPFCIDSSIPIRYRDLASVGEELAWLEGRGVREIYFYDPNFTARPARVREFARMVADRGLRPSFVCNAQVACMGGNLAQDLAAAGCHTVMFGLESGNDDALQRNRKGFDTRKAREAVAQCKAAGLKVLAYFLLGLPGETGDSARRTIDFATSLPLDYVSFNVFAPTPGTGLGTAFLGTPESADGGRDRSAPARESRCELPPDELMRLRRHAYLRFYGRPAYLLSQLARVRAPGELARLTRAAWRLARNAME
jgi:radical SAM superfamily enzyme YgiQ (UPF0313 family)